MATLVAYNADPNSASAKGERPAHLAAAQGHLAVVEYLAESKADFSEVDGKGFTALALATRRGHAAIIHRLSEDTEL